MAVGVISSNPTGLPILSGLVNRGLVPRISRGGSSQISFTQRLSTASSQELLRSRFVTLDKANIIGTGLALEKTANKILDLKPFQVREATVSNQDALSVSASDNATIQSVDISIQQLAKSEVVISNRISASGTTDIQTGSNTIKITQDTRVNTVDISVSPGETNQTVFERIRDAINNQKLGVSAKTITPLTGLLQLEVSSNTPGTNSAFKLEDVKGDIVAKTGLNTAKSESLASGVGGIRVPAQNALVEIEGVSLESQTNVIKLDNNRLSITLRAPIELETIKVNPKFTDIQSATSTLVSAINDTRLTLASGEFPAGNIFRNRLDALLIDSKQGLGSIGIKTEATGPVSINNGTFREAVENQFSNVQTILTDLSRGLSSIGNGIAKRAELINSSATRFNQIVRSLATEREGSIISTLA